MTQWVYALYCRRGRATDKQKAIAIRGRTITAGRLSFRIKDSDLPANAPNTIASITLLGSTSRVYVKNDEIKKAITDSLNANSIQFSSNLSNNALEMIPR